MHSSHQAHIALIKANKASITTLFKYSDFVDIFSLNLVAELSEYTRINDYAIKLIHDKQPPYEPIYSLELVKLETLNTYIKTSLANGFIKHSKFPKNIPILFIQKLDSNLCLYINY